MPVTDKTKITEELESLQLEEARAVAEDRRNRKIERKHRVEGLTRALQDANKRQKEIQSRCLHRKGGKGISMLYQGNDPNYAVIKHTLSHGPVIVVCQRCTKVWEPPPRELVAKAATPEMRAEYRVLLEQYRWALNLPTDNEPSGTVLFAFTEEPAA
jgi:hypothetical protein